METNIYDSQKFGFPSGRKKPEASRNNKTVFLHSIRTILEYDLLFSDF